MNFFSKVILKVTSFFNGLWTRKKAFQRSQTLEALKQTKLGDIEGHLSSLPQPLKKEDISYFISHLETLRAAEFVKYLLGKGDYLKEISEGFGLLSVGRFSKLFSILSLKVPTEANNPIKNNFSALRKKLGEHSKTKASFASIEKQNQSQVLDDFCAVMQRAPLETDEFVAFLNSIQQKLSEYVKSFSDYVQVLKHLKPEQCTVFIQTILKENVELLFLALDKKSSEGQPVVNTEILQHLDADRCAAVLIEWMKFKFISIMSDLSGLLSGLPKTGAGVIKTLYATKLETVAFKFQSEESAKLFVFDTKSNNQLLSFFLSHTENDEDRSLICDRFSSEMTPPIGQGLIDDQTLMHVFNAVNVNYHGILFMSLSHQHRISLMKSKQKILLPLASLSAEQCAEVLNDIISNSVEAKSDAFQERMKILTEKAGVFKALKTKYCPEQSDEEKVKKISKYIKTSRGIALAIKEYPSDHMKTEILKMFSRINTPKALFELLEVLKDTTESNHSDVTESHCSFVFNKLVSPQLSRFVQTAEDLTKILPLFKLEERSSLIWLVKRRLSGLVKTPKTFFELLACLKVDQPTEKYVETISSVVSQLSHFIKSTADIGKLLQILPSECYEKVFNNLSFPSKLIKTRNDLAALFCALSKEKAKTEEQTKAFLKVLNKKLFEYIQTPDDFCFFLAEIGQTQRLWVFEYFKEASKVAEYIKTAKDFMAVAGLLTSQTMNALIEKEGFELFLPIVQKVGHLEYVFKNLTSDKSRIQVIESLQLKSLNNGNSKLQDIFKGHEQNIFKMHEGVSILFGMLNQLEDRLQATGIGNQLWCKPEMAHVITTLPVVLEEIKNISVVSLVLSSLSPKNRCSVLDQMKARLPELFKNKQHKKEILEGLTLRQENNILSFESRHRNGYKSTMIIQQIGLVNPSRDASKVNEVESIKRSVNTVKVGV